MICRRILIAFITLGALMGMGMLQSCGGHSDKIDIENMERVMNMDSLVRVYMRTNPEEALAYIDSMETADEVSKPVICYCRGVVYNTMMQKTTSELYFKKALEDDRLLQESPELYYKAHDYLASFLSNRGENAEALAVATQCYEVARQDDSPLGRQWTAILLHAMGYFQTQLGMKELAERNFSLAYMALSQMVERDSSNNNLITYARVSYNILDAYTSTEQYDEALKWVSSAEIAAAKLSANPQCLESDRVRFVGGVATQKAMVMAKLGMMDIADASYREAQEVGYFDTAYGILEQARFLRLTERWNELVEMIPKADSVAKEWNVPMSLYYMKEYMVPRFDAYLNSGMKEKALEVAELMAESVDSVAAHELNHEMTEIEVIAKQKDMNTEVAMQETVEAFRWVKILCVVLMLVIVVVSGCAIYQWKNLKKKTENK